MEINVDVSFTVSFADGSTRTFALDRTVVVGDNPRFLVKEARKEATRVIGDLCSQMATATGHGYSGQPVVQDYAHRLMRLSDQPDPSFKGDGHLDDDNPGVCTRQGHLCGEPGAGPCNGIPAQRVSPPHPLHKTSPPFFRSSGGYAPVPDLDAIQAAERKAKGCTHPADQPCFGRHGADSGGAKNYSGMESLRNAMSDYDKGNAPIVTGRDDFGEWYSKHWSFNKAQLHSEILAKEEADPTLESERMYRDEMGDLISRPKKEPFFQPESDDDDVPPNAGSSS